MTVYSPGTIVVFESVYHEAKEVAVHADLEDEDQTIIIRRKGGLLIRKTSEDDFVEGISFIVAGGDYEETLVTDKQGQIYVQDLLLPARAEAGKVKGISTVPVDFSGIRMLSAVISLPSTRSFPPVPLSMSTPLT